MSGRKFDRERHSGFPNDDPAQRWPELLIGLQEIAQFLRVSKGTARKWIANGQLIAVRDSRGRYTMLKEVYLRHFLMRYEEQKARGIVANGRRQRRRRKGAEEPEGVEERPALFDLT